MPSTQFHNLCFTCNECNSDHGETHPDVQYCIFGMETAPKTGKQHLQGYYQFKRKVTLSWYKKNICSSCHVEQAKGTLEQNQKYCSKEGKVVTYGKPKVQGYRSDLHALAEEVKTKSLVEVITEHPTSYIRNYRGVKDYLTAVKPPQFRDVEEVKYGTLACSKLPTEDVYYVYDNKPYQYHGQKTMILARGVFPDAFDLTTVISGRPCCIMGVPCEIVKVIHHHV